MKTHLHANARTTPKVRAELQASDAPVRELARRYGVSETTVRKWRKRGDTQDRSHARHNLGQATSPAEEALIAALRRRAGLSLDDITEVMARCVRPISRSAIWRALRRMGLNRAPTAAPAQSAAFEDAPFGFVHVDLMFLGKLKGVAEFAFVAIERVSRFAYVDILPDRTRATVTEAMRRCLDGFGFEVHTILTDNGAEFTDRFAKGAKTPAKARPSGRHPFDTLCAERGIEHRLTRPYRPQTNGMVERFNRRIGEALRALPRARDNSRHRTRFKSHAQRAEFIKDFVYAYNRTRLRCLDYNAPIQIRNNLQKDNTPGRAFVDPLKRLKLIGFLSGRLRPGFTQALPRSGMTHARLTLAGRAASSCAKVSPGGRGRAYCEGGAQP